MSQSKYEAMTIDELDAEIIELGKKRDEIKAEMFKVTRVRDAKATLLAAKHKLDQLSDAERRALVQVIQAQGIESGEEVGTPGAAESPA